MKYFHILLFAFGISIVNTAIAGNQNFAGIYVGGDRENGVVTVRDYGKRKFSMNFDGQFGRSIGSGSQGGFIEGIAVQKGSKYIFESSADPVKSLEKCKMSVKLSSKGMDVEEVEGCSGFHGAAAEFSGHYRKVFSFPSLD